MYILGHMSMDAPVNTTSHLDTIKSTRVIMVRFLFLGDMSGDWPQAPKMDQGTLWISNHCVMEAKEAKSRYI